MIRLHPIDDRAARAWPCLRAFAALAEGAIVIDERSGVRLRMMAEGQIEEVNAIPRRWSVSADPAVRARR